MVAVPKRFPRTVSTVSSHFWDFPAIQWFILCFIGCFCKASRLDFAKLPNGVESSATSATRRWAGVNEVDTTKWLKCLTLCCRTRSAWILSKWSQLILFSEHIIIKGSIMWCFSGLHKKVPRLLHCPTLSYTSMGSGWDPKPRPYGPASHCCGGSGTFSSVTASASFLIQGLCHHLIHLGLYHVYGIWHMGT